jgi:hypothetical protein
VRRAVAVLVTTALAVPVVLVVGAGVAHAAPPHILDYDGDGDNDSAAGAPMEDLFATDVGAVTLGLSTAPSVTLSQSTPGVAGAPETDDHFGSSLGAGDFDDDGYTDLVVGVPDEDLGTIANAGVVHVFYGSASGPQPGFRAQLLSQDAKGIPGVAETNDRFGSELVAGDFNGDGFDDLVIAARGEAIGAAANAGLITVLYGTARGLRVNALTTNISQNTSGVASVAENGDAFGRSLTAGDFNRDHRDDLAVGSPGEDIGSANGAGVVHVLRGTSLGLTGSGSTMWQQGVGGVTGVAESGDAFGRSLTHGDFDHDEFDDLAIGAPGEALGAIAGAGLVEILFGGSSGITSAGRQEWTQNSAGIANAAEPNDAFGTGLAASDVNGDGRDDLAVGAPGEDASSGAVHIILGASSAGLSGSNSFLQLGNVVQAPVSGDRFGALIRAADLDDNDFGDVVYGIPAATFMPNPAGSGMIGWQLGRAIAPFSPASSGGFTQTAAGETNEAGDAYGASLPNR